MSDGETFRIDVDLSQVDETIRYVEAMEQEQEPRLKTEFKLRAFMRTVFNKNAITDPDSLAKEVLRALDPQDERAALEQALRMAAQNFLTHARGSLTSLGGRTALDTHSERAAGGRTTSSKSWKTQGSREFWGAQLEQAWFVGHGQWTALGDLDAAALTSIAEHREMLSTANAKEAAGAREWIALLEQHGAATVRKLPLLVLRERLEGGAAA